MRVSTFQNANWAKESVDGFKCATAIPPKSSNLREEKPSYE